MLVSTGEESLRMATDVVVLRAKILSRFAYWGLDGFSKDKRNPLIIVQGDVAY